MDKEDVAHIYTMEYYSAIKRNEIWSFVEMWMDLEKCAESPMWGGTFVGYYLFSPGCL